MRLADGSAPALERVLRHDRYIVAAALAVVTLLCWAWIYPMARDMYGAMDGPSAWMMTTEWDAPRLLLLCAMWIVMMAGMMLPSAAPMLLLYAGVLRRQDAARGVMPRVYALGAGYLLVWTLFSVGATVLQRALNHLLLLTPMMEMASAAAIGVILLLAGIYQLTPLKARCLQACRAPLTFVMQHSTSAATGAFRLGVLHGLYCLGCCWALMLLLFAGGVMNLYVITGLTLLVLVEKVAPLGGLTSRLVGIGLIGLAVWIVVTSGAP